MVATFKVYKKSSPNGKIVLYLGRREMVDYIAQVDPVDGVVLVHEDYLRNMRLVGQIVVTFRYGREQDEVMGLKFFKELVVANDQVYPPSGEFGPLSRLQDRLIKKLGQSAFPFRLQIPVNAPQSVTLQPGRDDAGEPCGVYYDVKVFLDDGYSDQSSKRNTVRLGIRKIQWAPVKDGRQPCAIVRRDFLLSPGELELECTLDKQLYRHNEEISVNVNVRNFSNKTVKRIRVAVVQNIDICMFASGHCKAVITSTDTMSGCPIVPGASLQKIIQIHPEFYSHLRRGVALDGPLKKEDTNLASSTLLQEDTQREAFGIIVSYCVKVKLLLGSLGGEVSAELPFILMHPKPHRKPTRLDSEDRDLKVENFQTSRDNTIDLDDASSDTNLIFDASQFQYGKSKVL